MLSKKAPTLIFLTRSLSLSLPRPKIISSTFSPSRNNNPRRAKKSSWMLSAYFIYIYIYMFILTRYLSLSASTLPRRVWFKPTIMYIIYLYFIYIIYNFNLFNFYLFIFIYIYGCCRTKTDLIIFIHYARVKTLVIIVAQPATSILFNYFFILFINPLYLFIFLLTLLKHWLSEGASAHDNILFFFHILFSFFFFSMINVFLPPSRTRCVIVVYSRGLGSLYRKLRPPATFLYIYK